jgi:fructoselysine-6-P-deglycase FrlB-like protein
MTGATKPPLVTIFDEMSRQAEDARQSFARNGEVAARIAEAARQSGRLILLGIGGSHAVNRTAEVLYRKAGLDATAVVVSEALNAPIPTRGATVVLTSQSGESGEIVAYLQRDAGSGVRFGLTLNPDSTLAKSVSSLVGHGGVEQAFAATRSLYVSLALHARVLHELGHPHNRIIETATKREAVPFEAAIEKLSSVDAMVFSGRAEMQGVAEAAALGMMELGRLPAFALEGGQLRHGPVEALGQKLGIVFIRQAGADTTGSLAKLCVDGGSPTIVFDLSGEPPVPNAKTIAFAKCSGIEAALTVLPTLQRFIFEVARRRVANVGEPVRSSKVTRET